MIPYYLLHLLTADLKFAIAADLLAAGLFLSSSPMHRLNAVGFLVKTIPRFPSVSGIPPNVV